MQIRGRELLTELSALNAKEHAVNLVVGNRESIATRFETVFQCRSVLELISSGHFKRKSIRSRSIKCPG